MVNNKIKSIESNIRLVFIQEEKKEKIKTIIP